MVSQGNVAVSEVTRDASMDWLTLKLDPIDMLLRLPLTTHDSQTVH